MPQLSRTLPGSGTVELYLYFVFGTFHIGPPLSTANFDEPDNNVTHPALRRVFNTLYSTVVRGDQGGAMSSAFGSSSGDPDPASNTMVEVRHTASAVSLDRLRIPMETEPVFALAQAVAGMESLRNFADVVISLRPELAAALSAAETNTACAAQGATTLNAMLNDSFRLVPLMCTQIYRRIARSMLAFEPVANGVRNRLWTPKEPSSQHNSYVDMLLQLVQQLNVSITSLSLPHHVHTALLEEGVGHVARQLVEREHDPAALVRKGAHLLRQRGALGLDSAELGLTLPHRRKRLRHGRAHLPVCCEQGRHAPLFLLLCNQQPVGGRACVSCRTRRTSVWQGRRAGARTAVP